MKYREAPSEKKVSDKKTTKKISAKAIMTDLKAGMSDTELMEKYEISFQGLQDLFGKLIDAKLATRAYFDKRAGKQVGLLNKKDTTRTCPYCGYSSADPFKRCPRCHNDADEWLDTVELTKILTGSFE
ncbi:MAG: hypothetical protein WBG50_19855 [Desulfomonilaceae bacterium]